VTDARALLETVSRLAQSDDDADDILRAVVSALVDSGTATWAGIFFVEEGELVLGPEAGAPDPAARTTVPVIYEHARVAELAADRCPDTALLAQVADLVALLCLVGWDTGGVPWDDPES
jgi:hypothetical protein